MKRPAVFFDRDNTLIISDGYLADPAKVVLVPGAAEAVARARALGYATVVVSNQSGVARGLFDEAAVLAVNRQLEEMLKAQNAQAIIDRHEYCPFHPDAVVERYRCESPLRKPAPGMILAAAEAMALDLPRSWVIGDAPRDVEAGRAAGCRTILFQDPNLPLSPAATNPGQTLPDHYVQSLKDAMDIIQRQPATESRPAPAQSDAAVTVAASAPADAAVPAPVAAAPTGEPDAMADFSQIHQHLEQIAAHLGANAREQFSITKLLAGIIQIMALAVGAVSYLSKSEAGYYILVAIFLQLFTIALLIMGRQR